MDQLFVNERLPSPSPPGSSHGVEEEPNPWRESESSSTHRGKAPEAPAQTDEADLSYAPQRGQRVLMLEGRDESSEQSWHTTKENEAREGRDGSFLERYGEGHAVGKGRRPTLSGRLSTGEGSQRSTVSSGANSSRDEGAVGNMSDVTGGGETSSNLDIYGTEERSTPSRQGASEFATDSSRPTVPRRYSRPVRPYSYAGGSNTNDLSAGAISPPPTGLLPSQVFGGRTPLSEVVVPRWQPDAEVTFCPICRTQFSFFVRKHHCRKCGRVVCNSCSPHRITIPHQYIVQPPTTDQAASTTRPAADSSRTRSQTIVQGLGGGERVRLCNPCVPDPNIAPPQTRSDGQPIQGHSRSQSTVPFSASRRDDLDIPSYRSRPREASITPEARQNRYWAGSPQPGQQQTSSSFGPRGDSLLRPDLEARSRSSTVGSTREGSQNATGQARPDGSTTYSRPYPGHSRPLPNIPQTQQRTTPRRQIREEDLCWLCGHELPSRDLSNFEDLRSAHVIACLEAATQRASGSPSRTSTSSPAPPPPPPPPPPQSSSTPQRQAFTYANIDPRLLHTSNTSSTSASIPTVPSSTSQPATPAPTLSTPESRMLARERQHAAIVLGQSSSSSSGPSSASAMSRVIPYIASEKDGIDDAECMICMEEFEVGQEMGRLECFCRFHLTCIRGWFEKRPGKCPVHGGDFF